MQVVETSGCWLLSGFVRKPHLSPADFPDATCLECSANRLRMETMFPARLVLSCPLLLLTAGLLTGGQVRVVGCGQDRLVTAITTLLRMGARVDLDGEGITASAPDGLRPAAVQTDVHPGFMTDWQTSLMVLFTQADGMSVLHETVYEDRFVYVPALQAMGAEIELFASCLGGPACRFHDTSSQHSAIVRGVSKLRGAQVDIPDVRAGFSSVIAAAAAQGSSVLRGVHHLERGYHRPAEQLRSLGLDLTMT